MTDPTADNNDRFNLNRNKSSSSTMVKSPMPVIKIAGVNWGVKNELCFGISNIYLRTNSFQNSKKYTWLKFKVFGSNKINM